MAKLKKVPYYRGGSVVVGTIRNMVHGRATSQADKSCGGSLGRGVSASEARKLGAQDS